MTMIVVGSLAAKIRQMDNREISNLNLIATPKEAKDFMLKHKDFICGKQLVNNIINCFYKGKLIEIELTFPGSSAEMLYSKLQGCQTYSIEQFCGGNFPDDIVCCPRDYICFLYKKSFIKFLDNCDKHLYDYIVYKNKVMGQALPWEMKWFELKCQENLKRFNKGKKKKGLVKLFNKKDLTDHSNLLEKIKSNNNLDEELFCNLTYQQKIELILTKAYEIALEEKIIPLYTNNGENIDGLKNISEDAVDGHSPFTYGLCRIATDNKHSYISSFVTDAYVSALEYYNNGYLKTFNYNFKKGKIKCLKKN